MAGQYGIPGMSAISETVERSLIWGGDVNQVGALFADSEILDSGALDANSTPTTDLRAGLLLGKNSTTGELSEWDADESDGTQNLHSILPLQMSTLDEYATAEDKLIAPLVRAPLVAAELLIQGSAFVGHADEFLARNILAKRGCLFDDDLDNQLSGLLQRVERLSGTSDDLETTDNGGTFIYTNAAAVTVNLPAIQPGLTYWFVREGDEALTVTSAEGDNIIGVNNFTADSIEATAASNHIGAHFGLEAIYVDTTPHWLPKVLTQATITFVDT